MGAFTNLVGIVLPELIDHIVYDGQFFITQNPIDI